MSDSLDNSRVASLAALAAAVLFAMFVLGSLQLAALLGGRNAVPGWARRVVAQDLAAHGGLRLAGTLYAVAFAFVPQGAVIWAERRTVPDTTR